MITARETSDLFRPERYASLQELGWNESAQAGEVLTRLSQRLEPYTTQTSYGMMDAGLILLREGLEALLVLVAGFVVLLVLR